MKTKRSIITCIGGGICILMLVIVWSVLGTFSSSEENIILIHKNDSPKTVIANIRQQASGPQYVTFRLLTMLTGYTSHIRPGRYDIGSGQSALTVFRHLRSGGQTPVRLTLPVLRTVDDLADFLGEHLEPSGDAFYQALTDSALLAKYGLKPETAVCLFLPNTYEIYWTVSPEDVLVRMDKESKAFWTTERLSKLEGIATGFTKEEAMTLASIVEQETQYNPERPAVAGMYINRLHQHMPLQADPTVKFALQDFGIKRILHQHLTVDSPYNTYKVQGLPPGPICIPSLASIDAVLNYQHHSYIYMCAKEDFSGSHNFATTYTEHLKNAAKYAKALDEHGIK